MNEILNDAVRCDKKELASKIVTRFAPSPTGFLHIGGARTALFNWLLARHFNGKFLLRIEDTDRVRSTKEAIDAIFKSLEWLGILWDEEPVFQFSRADRHVELAKKLVEEGKAYYCYCTPEELKTMRDEALKNHASPRYNRNCRDNENVRKAGVNPVIRLKAPTDGETILNDLVQGEVRVSNDQLDDMILVRSDSTPTFMLSVVVDDHDMGVTHVIRGDDHLTNTFRQMHIYKAFGWEVPEYGHIPLIHGPDGAKLSKRHGALGVENYKDMGFLPDAICNYLLRLGWSHGNDEIISKEKAIEYFNIKNFGKSASRFDFAKLTNLNAHYMKNSQDEELFKNLLEFIDEDLPLKTQHRILKGMTGLKQRAKTMLELKEMSKIYSDPFTPLELDDASKFLATQIFEILQNCAAWDEAALEETLRADCAAKEIPFGKCAQLIRNMLTGKKVTPGIFDMLVSFGREESLRRLKV